MTPIPLQETQLAELFRLREKCAAQAAVIEKLNSAEPVCWITPDGEGWRMRYEPPVIDTKLGWSPLYEHPPVPVASAK